MNDDEYLKQNPEFDARQKEKHSTPVASATTEQEKAPVSNGSTTSTNITLYPALGCLSYFVLLPWTIILASMAKESFRGDASIWAMVSIIIISFFPCVIFCFMGDVVRYLKEIIEILENRQ